MKLKKGIKLSLKKSEAADLSIILLEPKSKENQHFLTKYKNKKSIIVLNKVDNKRTGIPKVIRNYKPIMISIKNKRNIQSLIKEIKFYIKKTFKGHENILITRARHRENLEACLKNLKDFSKKNKLGDFDKAAEDLRLASRSLGKITGKVDVEEILDSIFNDFCIGK